MGSIYACFKYGTSRARWKFRLLQVDPDPQKKNPALTMPSRCATCPPSDFASYRVGSYAQRIMCIYDILGGSEGQEDLVASLTTPTNYHPHINPSYPLVHLPVESPDYKPKDLHAILVLLFFCFSMQLKGSPATIRILSVGQVI